MSENPAEFPKRAAVMRAYDSEDAMIVAEVVGERRVESVIASLLGRPEIAYLHARNLTEGCFMFRIEREESAR